jgi:dTDP-4-dehydrorhamnose 3,5-epimerase
MFFTETPLQGAYLISLEKREDKRGYFARAFCTQEFSRHKLETKFVQANISFSAKSGLIRGMHYQCGEHAEVKLVSCVRGSIYDVIVDLRKESPTYMKWFGAELSDHNGHLMYVPKGFAHGYQALSDDAFVHYMVSAYYSPDAEDGIKYNEPAIGIKWPIAVTDISQKDAEWPLMELR